MSRLTRDGTAELVSRDQILRHARGQGIIHFPCSADHEQDWQPYPVDPYSAICDDHTYIHTYTLLPLLRQFSSPSKKVQFYCVVCVCVYVCCHPIYSGRKVCGRTSRGHTEGRPHRISPPSFCGAYLNFSREKNSAIPFPRRHEGEFCVLTI